MGDNPPFSADGSARVGKRAMVGNLEFERGIGLPGIQARMHRAAHDGIEQSRRITAMHGANGVVNRLRGRTLKRHETLFRRYGMNVERLDDALIASPPAEDPPQTSEDHTPELHSPNH